MNENEFKTKVQFQRPPNYFNVVATDLAVSGPTPDNLIHFAFFTNIVDLLSQTAYQKGASLQLSFEEGDVRNTRELVGQVRLTPNALDSLLQTLLARLLSAGQEETIKLALEKQGYTLNKIQKQ